jgi:hypothetical protein
MGHPLLWAAVAGWLLAAGTYIVKDITGDRAVSASYAKGKTDGAAEVAAASKKASEKANEDARQAHRDARLPGSVERLRKSGACRDCGGSK